MNPDAIGKARQARASAQLLLEAGDNIGAINRAYYSMFYAAHAALAHEGIDVPSAKHGTLVARFGQHLVKTGRVPDRFGRWLNRALEVRAMGDYGDATPNRTAAEEAIARAEAFLEAVESVLQEPPPLKPRGRRA